MIQNLAGKVTSTRGGALALGLGAAIVAAVLLVFYVTGYRSSVRSEAASSGVLVARQLIVRGTPGTSIGIKQLYRTQTVATSQLKLGAITDPALLNGRAVARDIYPGQQLTLGDFADAAAGGSGVATTIVGPQRAVTISIDRLDGSLDNLQTGDHVDIYQRLTSPQGPIVKLFRADVPVIQAPGLVVTSGTPATTGAVVLQVPTRDAADLLFASRLTTLEFVIRPANGAAPTIVETANAKTMLQYTRTH